MKTVIETRNYGKITIVISVEARPDQPSQWFNDLYTESEHIGGTTVAIPSHLAGRTTRHYIGQTKPSELAASLAELGDSNPSRNAYESLQSELAHYIQAYDCVMHLAVYKNDILLGEAYGITFDYSCELDSTLEEMGKEILKTYGVRDMLSEAIDASREFIKKLSE